MRKALLLIILISTTIIFYGCNKNSNEDNPISLYSVDISSLNNKKILDVIHDEGLEEGVYQIITDSNKYIFLLQTSASINRFIISYVVMEHGPSFSVVT